RSISSSKRVYSHQVIIKGLNPGADYSVRYYSKDKQGNRSSVFEQKFTTRSNNNIDQAGLIISDFRPNSLDDPNVGDTSLTISFKTNRWAKGRLILKANNTKTKTQNLDHNTYHAAVLDNLKPATKYNLTVYLTDVYGKKLEQSYVIETKSTYFETPGNGINSVGAVDFGASPGYYGQYYNFSENDKIIKIKDPKNGPKATGWYEPKYFSFAQVDPDLNFGCNFFPINTDLPGDPYYFAVHWGATIEVPATGSYNYSISSDDDSWVLIDGQIAVDLGGTRKAKEINGLLSLNAGAHTIDIYYAERKPKGACMSFVLDSRITVRPRHSGPINGSGGSFELIDGGADFGNGSALGNGAVGAGGVIVAGISNTVYTDSSGLFRALESPDVYTIMNNQRHYISSPDSFNTYAYRWEEIKMTSQSRLEKYPRARLIKSPDKAAIYYLYQRPENQWLKIALNSPTVFISYPENYWGNVITVTEQDVNSYPDARFIKTEDNKDIYYLKNNIRHLISREVFDREGYNPHEAAIVNQVHMDSYLLSDPVK
ncbi:MAG: hypothetical protein KAJ48_08090, partial [Elusimicrobiales bacterium]|nr:hypothetical protein [Elusimicrobiales bacterium]